MGGVPRQAVGPSDSESGWREIAMADLGNVVVARRSPVEAGAPLGNRPVHLASGNDVVLRQWHELSIFVEDPAVAFGIVRDSPFQSRDTVFM